MAPFLPNSLITDHFKYPPSYVVLLSFFLKTPSDSSLSVNPWFLQSVLLTLPTWKKNPSPVWRKPVIFRVNPT
ncbi:unnamed protein product, partial [Vitis vinifera]|uniref:Uncharacterized protein n=1 Tax=Vitis vinifera TaxID=29760 RepID=D7SRL5_VITVI